MPAPPPSRSQPPERSAYLEALAVYEQGIAALQHKQYARAAQTLRAVLERYPDERELHERARLYLRVCERHVNGVSRTPRTPEERVYAATLALNAGGYDEAIRHLSAVSEVDPENDHAEYMLAAAHALRGEADVGLAHLRRAIELNKGNRALARIDPDLDALRSNPAFLPILAAGASAAGAPRRSRTRRSR